MWRHRNIRRLAVARFISSAGGEAAFFVGIWGRAAFDFDATPQSLAVMMAVLGVTSLAGTSLAGVLVDRFGPRRVLLAGEVVFAPAALALILPGDMVGLTAVVGIVGLVSSVVYTAVASFPPFLTDDHKLLGEVNAAMEVASTSAFIAGPALGALLARYVGLDWIFVLDAATSVVAVLLIVGVTTRRITPAAHTNALRELREGFRFAYGLGRLRFLLLLGMATWLSFGVFSALEPIFYREVLRTGPEALGIVNAFFGAGLAAGSLLMTRFAPRLTTVTWAAALTVGGGVGAVAYSGTPSVVIVTIGGIAWGVMLGMLLPVLRTLVQSVTPDHLQGRTMGVWQTHNTVGEMLPLLIVPAMAAAVGVQRVLIGSGLLVVVVGLASLPAALRMDRAGVGVAAAAGTALAGVAETNPKHPVEPVAAPKTT